jgi:hypothetical protein
MIEQICLDDILNHSNNTQYLYGTINQQTFEDTTQATSIVDARFDIDIQRLTKEYNVIKQFKYGWNTKTMEQFIRDKTGCCIDAVNYLYHKLIKYDPKCYYIEYLNDKKNIGGGHAFIVFFDTIIIEVFTTELRGIIQFKSLDDIFQAYKKIIQPQYPKSFNCTTYQFSPVDRVMSFSGWSVWVWKTGHIIT